MKFADYRFVPEIKQNLANLGFNKPTDIQYKSIPPINKGEDVLAIAQTGTGKTAAFAIPVINKLQEAKRENRPAGIKCLVMEPTHELALQVTEVFEKIAFGTQVVTYCIHGGVDQAPQIKKLQKGIDILIATPGRMFDLVSQGYLKLENVEILVLDEADHMLDLGFIRDIRDLIHFLPRTRQTLFFSATINETIKDLAYSLVRNAIRIQISPKDKVNKNINHSVAFIEMDDKRFFLERVVTENPDSKILVFVRTKVRAERVLQAMDRVGIKTLTIHSDKTPEERLESMKQFREGTVKVMIATDVSARGIDIPDVDYVVNYDLPDKEENYVHRVGRTGRGIRKGQAVAFCSAEEKPMLDLIQTFLGKEINVLEIKKEQYKETLVFTNSVDSNWESLLREAEKGEELLKKKKIKKPSRKLGKKR